MGMAAEVLAGAGHEVEIITHVPVAVETLAARFDLHLPGVRVNTTPLLPFDQLGDLSAAYDLWINASFMSVVPSRAPRSLLLVLFPFPLDETPFGRFKRRVAGHIHRELYVPRYGEGFFGPQELGGSRYRWTAGKGQVSISLPSLLGAPAAPGTGGSGGGGALPLRLVLGSFRPAGWGPVPVTVRAGGEVVLRTDVETTPGDYVTLDVDVPARLIAGRRAGPGYRVAYVSPLRGGGLVRGAGRLPGGGGGRGQGDGAPPPARPLRGPLRARGAGAGAAPARPAGRAGYGLPGHLRRDPPHLALLRLLAAALLGAGGGDPLPAGGRGPVRPPGRAPEGDPGSGALLPGGGARQAPRRHDPHLPRAGPGGTHGVGAAPRRGVDAGDPPPAVPPGVPAPGGGVAGAVPRRRPAAGAEGALRERRRSTGTRPGWGRARRATRSSASTSGSRWWRRWRRGASRWCWARAG